MYARSCEEKKLQPTFFFFILWQKLKVRIVRGKLRITSKSQNSRFIFCSSVFISHNSDLSDMF